MRKELTVSFIGSGNLAWHLAPALDNVGFVIKEIYSRNPRHAEQLTSRLYQAIREKQGLAYSVFSSLNTNEDSGNLIIYAGTDTKNVKKVVNTIATEMLRIKRMFRELVRQSMMSQDPIERETVRKIVYDQLRNFKDIRFER